MKQSWLALASLVALAAPAWADDVKDISFQEPNGDRVLQESIDIARAPNAYGAPLRKKTASRLSA